MRKLSCSIFLTALFLVLSVNKMNALNYYWIGGTGNWDDLTTGPLHRVELNCIMRYQRLMMMFFDAHSFTAAGQTLTLNPLTILCNNMDWTVVTNMPSASASINSLLKIYGSLTLVSAMIITQLYCAESFESTNGGKTITLAGQFINNNVAINGIGGGWTLQNAFTVGSIASPGTTICPGNVITFVALAQDTADPPPNYDFMVNGVSVQNGFANSFTSSSLLTGDAVSCAFYLPAGSCFTATTATSNSITIIVGNNIRPSAVAVAVCNDQLPYLWNGQAYIGSGDYMNHFTGSNGCDSIITLHLSVEPAGSANCICQLIIPNAITPNADGINDLWKILHTACILKPGVSIYNRYGS